MAVAGGFIAIVMKAGYIGSNIEYFENIEPHMKELEEARVWKVLEKETFPNYRMGLDGLWYVLQVEEGKNDVIEKTHA